MQLWVCLNSTQGGFFYFKCPFGLEMLATGLTVPHSESCLAILQHLLTDFNPLGGFGSKLTNSFGHQARNPLDPKPEAPKP